MAKTKQKGEVFTITIDPYEQEAFKFGSNGVEILNVAKPVQKESLFVSYLKFKDTITSTINIPKDVAEEDISNTISLKAYEELALDATADYKITYSEVQSQTEDRMFNVFAVDNKLIDGLFKNIVSKIPYIDYVALAPCLYQTLYKKGVVSALEIDCFICLQKDDAFLAIYSGGELFTSRPLRFNLGYIKDKFCEQTGDRISDEAFFNLLRTKGVELEAGGENFNEDLNAIFEDCLFYISDTINIISRIYSINIGAIYIDSQIGEILNLDKFVEKKLNIKTHTLKMNFAINGKDFNISQQHNMMLLLSKLPDTDQSFNFSNFLRPPSFTKRQSGKFLLTCAAAALISFAYPAYNYVSGYVLQMDAARLKSELVELKAEETRIKTKLAQIEAEKKRVQEETKIEEDRLKFRENLLTEIQSKKSNYAMKGENIFDLTNLLNSNEVQISNIKNDDRNITLSVISDDDKKITKLIKDITQVPKYSVDTKKIHFDKRQNNYESNITVEIRQ